VRRSCVRTEEGCTGETENRDYERPVAGGTAPQNTPEIDLVSSRGLFSPTMCGPFQRLVRPSPCNSGRLVPQFA
jgi:hypothetical protein